MTNVLLSNNLSTGDDHVEQLISIATKHKVANIPVGGGTNVTGALECSPQEKRMIVSLDTSQMVSISTLT